MPSTEHKFNTMGYGNLAGAISATATSMVLVEGGIHAFLPGWASSKYLYLTLVDPAANREIVKVSAVSGNTLTVARGQDGSVARAWPAGTLVTQRLVAANLAGMIQKEVFRSITVNPNGLYTAVYPGEKMYQSGPAAGQRRWWKNTTGTKWRLIAGALYGNEYLDGDGYVVTPVKVVPDTDIAVGNWEGGTFSGGFGGAGTASFSFVDSTIAAADDDSGIRYDFPDTCELKFADPGTEVAFEIDISIRANTNNPPLGTLTIALYTGAAAIPGCTWTIGPAGDEPWGAAVYPAVDQFDISFIGVVLTAAEAADLRVKLTTADAGIVILVTEIEVELW